MQVGERVLWFRPQDLSGEDRKFALPYIGPYIVTELKGLNNIFIRLENSTQEPFLVNVDQLSRCYAGLSMEGPLQFSHTTKPRRANRGRKARVKEDSERAQPSHQMTLRQTSDLNLDGIASVLCAEAPQSVNIIGKWRDRTKLAWKSPCESEEPVNSCVLFSVRCDYFGMADKDRKHSREKQRTKENERRKKEDEKHAKEDESIFQFEEKVQLVAEGGLQESEESRGQELGQVKGWTVTKMRDLTVREWKEWESVTLDHSRRSKESERGGGTMASGFWTDSESVSPITPQVGVPTSNIPVSSVPLPSTVPTPWDHMEKSGQEGSGREAASKQSAGPTSSGTTPSSSTTSVGLTSSMASSEPIVIDEANLLQQADKLPIPVKLSEEDEEQLLAVEDQDLSKATIEEGSEKGSSVEKEKAEASNGGGSSGDVASGEETENEKQERKIRDNLDRVQQEKELEEEEIRREEERRQEKERKEKEGPQ
ncbi:MAG: hypothetical protein GY820_46560 [Gammaproteobacteria bacterium]|nr:hypothetical protein [Gammaproteobacteria bacterium]